MRLNAALVPQSKGGYAAPLHLVPDALKERFQAEDLLEETANPPLLKIAFEARPRAGFVSVHRAHPLPGILAESYLETALDEIEAADNPAVLPRCGVWEAAGVQVVTTLLLLRIRHRIDAKGKLGPQFAMAEEAAAIAFQGDKKFASDDAAFALLEAESGNVNERIRDAQLDSAISALPKFRPKIDA